jgi:glutathione S-transferase
MQLIGQLDSPYVRRVAISMRLLGRSFEHRNLSVFRDFETFRGINPLVKVPTLVTDEGTILVDSSIILDHLEDQQTSGRSLVPTDPAALLESRRLIGISLVALEKGVSLLYERTQRPERMQHPGWIERNRLQLNSACTLLERALNKVPGWLAGGDLMQADITVAVTWTFLSRRMQDDVQVSSFPALKAFSRRAEQQPAFQRYPFPAS